MNIKIEPIDTMASLSSPANVAELVNGQNSNSSDANQLSANENNSSSNSNTSSNSNGTSVQQTNGTNGTNSQSTVITSSNSSAIVVDKSRDLETTVISLAPAQPYPSGTLTFAPAYDLSGQTQYTVQVSFK